MSMTTGHPDVVYNGIDDQSRGTPTPRQVTMAQHTPILQMFTQTGPEYAYYPGENFSAIYGAETLNRRGPYFNLQTLLAETLLAEGNGFWVKRLKPDNAGDPARIIIALDIVEDDVERTITRMDGFDYPEETDGGVASPSGSETSIVPGYRARLVLIEDNATAVGQQRVLDGSFFSERDGTQSQLYPLLELPASFFGNVGNLSGLRLWAATTNDDLPFDEKVVEDFVTRIYRIQFMRKSTPSTSAVSVRTRLNEEFAEICFTPGVYSESTDKEFYAPDVLIQQYTDDGVATGQAPMFPPFSAIHVYQENLDLVQTMVYNAEMAANPIAGAMIKGPGHIDLFTGMDIDGDHHHAFKLEGPLMGGLTLGPENTVYASGGFDGTMDLASWESLFVRQVLNFGELGDKYENVNVYGFSRLYDTGLTMDGKYACMNILPKRRDVDIAFTTYVESEGRAPTESEELSRTRALMARLRGFPESILYGTGVCRAQIVVQTGRLASGGYSKPVPQLLDYAQKWARMAGAGTGILRDTANMDEFPNNMIEMVKDLNVEYFTKRAQADLWANGATYSTSYDMHSSYYPCIKSVYMDDTSVLVSPITAAIVGYAVRVIHRVHAHFSGNANLTEEQLIDRCDRRILRELEGKFNNRVVIRPTTYFTPDDLEGGTAWRCKVEVFANNPRRRMIFEIQTRRMGDLNNG